MKETHNLSISYKVIATNLKPTINNYSYELYDTIYGDKTYVKVIGK